MSDAFDEMLNSGDREHPRPKMILRAPCVNSVELDMLAQKYQAECMLQENLGRGKIESVDIPPIFESEDGTLENAAAFHKHGINVTDVKSALAFRQAALNEIGQRYTRLIALARSMGPEGTWELFNELCKQEGLDYGNRR
jgi:hypothetical protein